MLEIYKFLSEGNDNTELKKELLYLFIKDNTDPKIEIIDFHIISANTFLKGFLFYYVYTISNRPSRFNQSILVIYQDHIIYLEKYHDVKVFETFFNNYLRKHKIKNIINQAF